MKVDIVRVDQVGVDLAKVDLVCAPQKYVTLKYYVYT